MIEANFIFYKTNPSKENMGQKLVLWKVATPEGKAVMDWGFSEWDGEAWGMPIVPEGYSVELALWANTIDPLLLTSKIVKV